MQTCFSNAILLRLFEMVLLGGEMYR